MTIDIQPESIQAVRRRRRSRAYIPIALLAAVQGLYIAAAPSVSVRQSELSQLAPSSGDFDAGGGFTSTGGDGTFGGTSDFDPTVPAGSGGLPGDGAVATTPQGGQSGSGGGAAPSATPGQAEAPGEQAAAADTSHCTPGAFAPGGGSGRQHDRYAFVQEAPACVPKWPDGADNGGATYRGVTADKVKVVIMEEKPNAQIDAITSAQGLTMSEADRVRIHEYGQAFANKYYENYGREVEFIRFKSKCPTTPPDVVTCKEEARKIIAMDPFAVIFGLSLYPEVFDEFARAGIISLGGWNFEDSYFTERRPFRYDVFMTGTKSADHLIEYYCKKLSNKPASNAGNLIHPSIGPRSTPRKFGIIVNEQPPLVSSARYVAQEIAQCEGNRYTPEVVTFVGDLDRGAETTEAVTSKMINSKTTTMVCWCGPLEMTGFTRSFTSQQYYPEHLLPGIGLSDADVFARLYDTAQWVHAFGPSHIADSRPTTEYQSYAVYKDAGDEGNHTIATLLYWLYMDLAVQGVQFAGPDLNPLTFERGLLSSPGTGGGDPKSVTWDWGQGDYGGYADVREVWYDPTLDSDFDGAKGGYRVLNDHRRFRLGEWSSEFMVPAAAT